MISTSDAPIQLYKRVSIQPTYIAIAPVYNSRRKLKSTKRIENEKNLKDNNTNGKLSFKAIRNLKNSVNWLWCSAEWKDVYVKKSRKTFKFKVNFITLTIPPQSNEVVKSKEFQTCLNTLFAYSRKYYFLKNYVWKVEKHKDNRLHVHILTDTFINYRALRSAWNRILQKRGLLNDHYNKFGNFDPNSTDVHGLHKVRSVMAYVVKYMSKEPELDKTFKGRIWGCSQSLSNKIKCGFEGDIYWNSKDYNGLDKDFITWKQIQAFDTVSNLPRIIADVCLLSVNDWAGFDDCIIKEKFIERVNNIRAGTPSLPKGYAVIDYFKGENFDSLEIKNNFEKQKIECEIEKSTLKIGQILLDLEY